MLKLQTQIALSATESEYIALLQSTREIIEISEVLREIRTFIISEKKQTIFRTHATSFSLDTISQSIVYENNESYLRFATMLKISPRTK